MHGSSRAKISRPFSPSSGEQNAKAVPAQVEVHQVGDVRIVLDDDHGPALRAHGPSLPPLRPRMAGNPGSLTEP